MFPTQNQRLIREMGLGFEEMSYKEIVTADGTVITDEQEGYPDMTLTRSGNEKVAGASVGKAEF